MKKLSLTLIIAGGIITHTNSLAQQAPVDTAAFSKIRKAEMSNSHIPQIAHYLTDVSGPRLTSSPGFKRAGLWAVETMKKWGLVNAALEPWGEFGKQWDVQEFSIVMKSPYVQSVMAYPVPWSASTNGLQQAQVVLLPEAQSMDTTYLSQHLNDYKGKFILVTGNATNTAANFKPTASRLTDSALANLQDTYMIPRSMIEQYKVYFKTINRANELIKRSGALAVIGTSRSNINGTVFVQTNGGFKLTDPEGLPRVSMAQEDGQKLKRLILSGQKVELALNIKATSSVEDTKGYNVVAEIPGSDPKLKSQLVMLGGHLDSWTAATGATDNAAGCIVMMEAVRLLDSLQLKPKRTIRIALWSGEEQGVYGSYNYVKNHFMSAAGVLKPEQAKVSAYFNLDNGTGKI
jgi:carboxypeptidase Q